MNRSVLDGYKQIQHVKLLAMAFSLMLMLMLMLILFMFMFVLILPIVIMDTYYNDRFILPIQILSA